MEEILLVSITFLFALYGLYYMKKVDLFINNNITSSYKTIYLDDPLLIKYFDHLSNVHFDIQRRSIEKICSKIENNLIDLAVYTTKPTVTNFNTLIITEIRINIYSNMLFTTLYVLHEKDDDIKWINQ